MEKYFSFCTHLWITGYIEFLSILWRQPLFTQKSKIKNKKEKKK